MKKRKEKVYFETYGCSANQNNSEIMKGILKKKGFIFTQTPLNSDFIVLNTCVVKEPTEKKIERRIQNLLKLKKPLIVVGCMPEVRKKRLNRTKNIYLLGTHHCGDIFNLIRDISKNKCKEEKYLSYQDEIKLFSDKINKNPVIGIIQISEGCLGNCSFCLTRIAKGKLFSYPKKQIIKNIKKDLNSGCGEIWITSQDNASYGLEKKKLELPSLLREILEIKKEFFLRLGMMNPNNLKPILKEMVDIYKNEKMFKFLHLPLQSGSNKILNEMKRYYSVEDFYDIIGNFRNSIPEITISTDVIVGFPNETERDFKETLEAIKKIKPDIINISRYWPMKGTSAEKMNQIPREIIKKRTKQLLKLYEKILLKKNKKWGGWSGNGIIDEFKNNFVIARNSYYKSVYLLNVKESGKKIPFGKKVNIKITKIKKHVFLGKLVS